MSWMDSWSRPSKSQATPAPYYLLPGGEDTPYCHSCGRVISSKRSGNAAAAAKDKGVKYCSSRCRSHKPGKLDREIEGVFIGFLNGTIEKGPPRPDAGEATAKEGTKSKSHKGKTTGGGKTTKGDGRVLVSCEKVERHVFPRDEAGSASGTEDAHTDVSCTDPESSQIASDSLDGTQPSGYNQSGTGTLEDPTSDAPADLDYDRVARLSIRSGTRIRPSQDMSEVNGSVGGEKGWAERVAETEDMLEKRREGMRRVRQREMVRCAARRLVVFGALVAQDDGAKGKRESEQERKCEAVMLGKVVEPSFAKGDWSVRWRE
ncbi:unnamed protein product [Discula destructiva]